MSRSFRTRLTLVVAFLAAVGVLAMGVWHTGYRQALDQLAQRGTSDLALAADRLTAELRRYQELGVLMADHPALTALHDGVDGAEASALLLEAADKAAALALIYVDTNGDVLAASGVNAPADLVDQPYLQHALNGTLGQSHGVSSAFRRRAYMFGAPSFAPNGKVRGVMIVVVDIEKVEERWRGARPVIFFSDADGRVFVSNRSELLFWTRANTTIRDAFGAAQELKIQTIADHEIWREAWSAYIPPRAIHLTQNLPRIDMIAEALVDVAPARRLAALQSAVVSAVCLMFGALLFLATERRRTLAQANTVLEARVAKRTSALSASNAALRREINERHEAEAALTRAQAELVQAGKLSALGQMSAGISHELNQPLMAIRSFAENGTEFLSRGNQDRAADNLGRISEMARRMGRIIKNLRAFARQESEPIGRVDIVSVVDAALEMGAERRAQDGIKTHWERPNTPVWVQGGEVRLEQVMLNLVTNASDAMIGQDIRELTVSLNTDGSQVAIQVTDTGPGIDDPERIFDPFYSTKQVGASEGMGLGLSISYGLVQSFGGAIKGRNKDEGGAVFTIELQASPLEEAA